MTDNIPALSTLRPERRRIGTPQEMDEWLKLAQAEGRALQARVAELETELEEIRNGGEGGNRLA